MKNKNVLIFVGLVIAGLLIGSSSVYFLMKANEKKCEKCEKCGKCEEKCNAIIIKESSKFGDEYFELLDKDIDSSVCENVVRSSLLNDWEEHYDYDEYTFTRRQDYKDFLIKLYDRFKNETTLMSETATYVMDDDYYNRADENDFNFRFNPNGTYIGHEETHEGWQESNGTYEIINNHLIILDRNSDEPQLLFLNVGKETLTSISYQDMMISSGTELIKK